VSDSCTLTLGGLPGSSTQSSIGSGSPFLGSASGLAANLTEPGSHLEVPVAIDSRAASASPPRRLRLSSRRSQFCQNRQPSLVNTKAHSPSYLCLWQLSNLAPDLETRGLVNTRSMDARETSPLMPIACCSVHGGRSRSPTLHLINLPLGTPWLSGSGRRSLP